MIKDLKKTFRHTFYYSISNFSTKLVGLILLPLYTTYLSPNEYGMYVIIEITSFILIDTLPFHFPTAMMRWSASSANETERKQIVFTSFLPMLIISFLLFLFFPFSSFFSELFFESKEFYSYFNYLIVISVVAIINQFQLSLLRYLEKSKIFLVLNISRFAIVVALNFYLLSYLKYGIEGVLISQLAGYLFVFVFSLRTTLSNMIFKFDKKIFIEMLRFIWPLAFSSLLLSLMGNVDKYIIKFVLGNAAVGVYTIGFRIASIINVVFIQSFQLGYLPYAFKKLGESNAKRFYSKVLTYYTLIISLTVLIISIFSEDILKLAAANEKYYAALIVIPFILFAFIFKGMNFIFSMGFHFSKKTTYHSLIALITFISSVITYYISSLFFGIQGVAAANIFIYLLNAVLALIFAQRFYPIKYEFKKVILILTITFVLYFLTTLIPTGLIIFSQILKILLVLSLPLLLKLFNFFEPIELDKINSFRQKIFQLIHIKKKAS